MDNVVRTTQVPAAFITLAAAVGRTFYAGLCPPPGDNNDGSIAGGGGGGGDAASNAAAGGASSAAAASAAAAVAAAQATPPSGVGGRKAKVRERNERERSRENGSE